MITARCRHFINHTDGCSERGNEMKCNAMQASGLEFEDLHRFQRSSSAGSNHSPIAAEHLKHSPTKSIIIINSSSIMQLSQSNKLYRG